MDVAPISPGTHKCLFIIIGFIELILGGVSLFLAFQVGEAIVWLLATFFLIIAGANFYQAFTSPHYRLWNFFSAIIYGLLAVLFFLRPVDALISLTILVGTLLIIGGVVRLIMSAKTKNGWLVFNGIITLLLGLMIIITIPRSAAWVLGTFVAVDLIFSGWALIGMGGMIGDMTKKR